MGSPSSSIKASESTSLFVVLSPTLLIPTSFGIDLRLWCAGAHDVTAPIIQWHTQHGETESLATLFNSVLQSWPCCGSPCCCCVPRRPGGHGPRKCSPTPSSSSSRTRTATRSPTKSPRGTDSPIWDP
ncbi:hypothetical protein JTE90_020886 [Oedothorax gibbosus]|uniref:Uncharacterized protein n=1 Tax=Oedothorax gibbosus TaxID=931172 RepID=A0AAV6TJP7_9ARAC|nr:hypothetical protein JTE90_020886 [Oedothorax gibbosus]